MSPDFSIIGLTQRCCQSPLEQFMRHDPTSSSQILEFLLELA
jgi:hypothetical protein